MRKQHKKKTIMKKNEDIYILGIESSCDDTSAAVLRNGVILSNVTASQDVHKAYGGVVPELASRGTPTKYSACCRPSS